VKSLLNELTTPSIKALILGCFGHGSLPLSGLPNLQWIDLGKRWEPLGGKDIDWALSVMKRNSCCKWRVAPSSSEWLPRLCDLGEMQCVKLNGLGAYGTLEGISSLLCPAAPKLSKMNLAQNFIREEAKALADALMSNRTLTSMNLGLNSIGNEGAEALADALKSNRTLTSMNLSRNSIGKEGAEALAEALKTNCTLTLQLH